MRKTIFIIGVIAFFSAVTVAQTKNDTIQQLRSQIMNLENLNGRLSAQITATKSNMKKLEARLIVYCR